MNLDMFDGADIKTEDRQEYKVLPVSVIDIDAQKKRKNEDHASTSSRANYSPFPAEVSDLCYEFYLRKSRVVVDPFAGWGERAAKAGEYGKIYYGFDISQKAIEKAMSDYGVVNILADSRFVDIPEFDGFITCPPYWNLEKYASENGIDREKKWGLFIQEYTRILSRFYDRAMSGAVFCIMVGDWRKNHIYYDLEFVTSNIFYNLGAVVIDKVVVSRKKVSKIKIMLPQAKRLGYAVRVHENLLVYRKP